ncbi:MAG TPA: hypothetical protein DD408_09305 [Rheinheimera sp.]|nr:hypothetical protein [Rheinheimera sp.]
MRRILKQTFRFNRVSLGLSLLCAALTAPLHADDDADLAALMALLETETEIATQNKMNADYVPGMVSVLHSEDLKQFGVTTVAQALNQVAGFYVTDANDGDKRVIARGVGATLSSGNLKFLLDGVPLNSATDGTADWLLRLPLNQIDRLEIVRGPGSAVHGEYAYSGVVNVISRKANAVALRAGSFNSKQLDGHYYQKFDNGLSVQLNVAHWQQDNSDLITNQDNFAGNGFGFSPAKVYDNEKGNVLQAGLEWQGYMLQLQHASTERGPAYGNNAAMPVEADPRDEKATHLSLSKPWQVSEQLTLKLDLAKQFTRLTEASYLAIPPGVGRPGGPPPTTELVYVQNGNEDTSSRANLAVNWNGIDNHKIYAGISYADYQVDDAFIATFTPGEEKVYGADSRAYVVAGSSRSLISYTLQDQWQLHEQVELTYGARYDRYNDWGSHLSPRVAAVWRLADRHILKAQYSEAFRPPTLSEAYPGPESVIANRAGVKLKEEVLKSTEASYIFRAPGLVMRATAFHTQIEDLIEFFIQPGRPPVWRNLADIDTYGIELEWEQQFAQDWEWRSSLAYVDAQDHLDSDEKLLGAVNWLFNANLIWHSSADTYHSLSVRYVGEQEGWEVGTRLPPTERYDSFNTLNYSFGVKNIFEIDGLTLSAGIKNLAKQRYNTVPSPAQFPQGLPHGSRSLWLQFEYSL